MGDLDPPQTVPCFRPSAFKNSFTPYRTFIIVVSHLEIPLAVYTNSPDNLRIARHKLSFNLNLSRRTVFTICVRGLDSKRKAIQSRSRLIGRQLANQFLSPRLSRYPGCVRVMECRETIFESRGGGTQPFKSGQVLDKIKASWRAPTCRRHAPHAAPLFLIGRKKHVQLCVWIIQLCPRRR